MKAGSATATLRAIGAEAISLQTHISQSNIKKLLEGDFEAFSAVQFNGFVTILEREYDLDLGEWRVRFAQTAPEPEAPLAEAENDPFANAVRAKKRQRLTVAVLAGLLLLVLVVTYLVLGSGGGKEKIELNNTAIEKARASMATLGVRPGTEGVPAAGETNATETNESIVPMPEVPPAEPAAPAEIIIYPKTTIWLGMIDEQTHKRQAKVTSEAVRLDGGRDWLIVTGHGLLTIGSGDENETYKQVDRMLFACENGVCRQIDEQEFKVRNRGVIW